ncbi:hypothetical protein CLV78_110126 [Aliiruegeria haliotis]|uniref:Uncharacterized protein n=1 Tax=Aliiruegeria haliotis TaxID=1280846 RepID=A0A2T0RJE4_9RHOB|nr:hypothetical protein CLV78_110126 [Aliiruegeria haliotis]
MVSDRKWYVSTFRDRTVFLDCPEVHPQSWRRSKTDSILKPKSSMHGSSLSKTRMMAYTFTYKTEKRSAAPKSSSPYLSG